MSKTFEILERVRQDRELFRIPHVTNGESPGAGPTKDVSVSDLNNYGQEQILKLVQYVFLGTGTHSAEHPRRVVFCGIDAGLGTDLVCYRVGLTLAEQVESKVCVVDAQRGSSLNSMYEPFSLVDRPLFDGGNTREFLRQITGNLWLASSYPSVAKADAPTLDQVQQWIKNLSDEFPYVVISAPPIGLSQDAALLSEMAAGLILVLEANSTRRAAARKAKQALDDGNVRVLGTVLNGRTFPIPEVLYRLL